MGRKVAVRLILSGSGEAHHLSQGFIVDLENILLSRAEVNLVYARISDDFEDISGSNSARRKNFDLGAISRLELSKHEAASVRVRRMSTGEDSFEADFDRGFDCREKIRDRVDGAMNDAILAARPLHHLAKELGVESGAAIRVRTEVGSAEFVCKEANVPRGMLFVPYGPPTCQLMGGDTDGTGMPTSKGWDVEVETIPTPQPPPCREGEKSN